MRKITSIIAVTVSICFLAADGNGQQNSEHAWLNRVISSPIASTQSVEAFLEVGAESFLNNTCQPSDLDGIKVLSVQTGHDEVFHLHIYCRQDGAASAHYKVTLLAVPDHKVDETAKTALGRTNVRLGPLYLGATGESDAILLIEKSQ